MKEDYLKRMLDEMGRVLGKVLFNIISAPVHGEVTPFVEKARQQLLSELDLDISGLLEMENKALVGRLRSRSFNNPLLEQLAIILYELGRRMEDRKERLKLYLKAKCLLQELNRSDKTYSAVRQKMLMDIDTLEKMDRPGDP